MSQMEGPVFIENPARHGLVIALLARFSYHYRAVLQHPFEPRELTMSIETRFKFGENWQSFVGSLPPRAIEQAMHGLQRLLPNGELKGCRFLDVGCGSGLHMLAAQRLGARELVGIDIDPQSAEATRTLLSAHAEREDWTTSIKSVFDLDPATDGSFDVVYSWGVLHHTGDMWNAIRKAAAMVAPGGQFVIALYRRTPLCPFWRMEKKIYSESPKMIQASIRSIYQAVYLAGIVATGRNPRQYIRNYVSARGMDWAHDVHDWLGGYPYESVDPAELLSFVEELGFSVVRCFERPAHLMGALGTHCDEFVARKPL